MIKGIIKRIFEWTNNNLLAQNLKVDPNEESGRWKKGRLLYNKNSGKANLSYVVDPSIPNLITHQLNPMQTVLPMNALGDRPKKNRFKLGSIQQQARSLKLTVNTCLEYLKEKSPNPITNWRGAHTLNLVARAGKDINAYYDRTSLKFFFFFDPSMNKNVFTCDSRSVVTHEFGHAFLDILRPDWWSIQSLETWAFHEAFGDITAIIASLDFDILIERAIQTTNGNLMESNVVTKVAAEMGTGLYNLTNGENGAIKDCLRDVSVVYNYVSPSSLPAQGRYDVLTKESHSFSRVFSGAFWELIVEIANFEKDQGRSLKNGVKVARHVLTEYLLKAVVNATNTNKLFNSIAKGMIQADKLNNEKYALILKNVFEKRNIIQAQNITSLNTLDIDTVLNDLKDPYEIQTLGTQKIIKTNNVKTIRLSDKIDEIEILNENPLLKLEIDVANQKAFYFENDQLVEIEESSEEEIIDSAFYCVDFLNKNKLVGNHEAAIFIEENGRLFRSQIACGCGCRKNYCDPQAPEYNKPWKPANNSGCVTCVGECLPASCTPPAPTAITRTKTGCYTTVKNGNRMTYKYSSNASRKVC